MRTQYLLYLLIFLIGVFVVVNIYRRRKAFFNFIFVCILLGAFLLGGNIINLNVLSDEDQAKIDQVVSLVGDSYIKVDSGSIYIKVQDEWMDLNEIKVVGEFTKDITIEYDGQEIYLGHSGVYNTIKVLQDVGLLGGKEEEE